jgi:hypothetical protein
MQIVTAGTNEKRRRDGGATKGRNVREKRERWRSQQGAVRFRRDSSATLAGWLQNDSASMVRGARKGRRRYEYTFRFARCKRRPRVHGQRLLR